MAEFVGEIAERGAKVGIRYILVKFSLKEQSPATVEVEPLCNIGVSRSDCFGLTARLGLRIELQGRNTNKLSFILAIQII